MTANKLQELVEEFRTVVVGEGGIADSVLPPVIFLIVNRFLGLTYAMGSALAVALGITALRLIRGQSWRYALGGLGGVLLAILASKLLGQAEGFFLPGIVTGALTLLALLISAVAGRPLVALTSYLTRRWPLDWYWHPRVRPAYAEVTWAWVIFFGLRLLLQVTFLQDASTAWLGLFNVLTGWPATVILLALSYLYGTWRLQNLEGPSVEEFERGDDPPWEGQRRGF
jgi:hypothetical protein